MKIRRIIIISAVAIAAVVIALYLIGMFRKYSDFTVISTAQENNGAYSEYAAFCGNLLVYGSDGITCFDVDGNPLWSQSYEIEQPIFDMCGSYVVIAQRDGGAVYIFNEEGYVNRIDAADRVIMAAISSEGTLALIMEKSDGCILQMLSSDGQSMAEGEIYTKNSGYPVGMDISYDGRLMAISCLTISSGNARTTVNFYSFSDAERSDSAVSYVYDNLVAPEVKFLSEDKCVIVGDTCAYLYDTSADEPSQSGDGIMFDDKVVSVFEGGECFGVIFRNENVRYESADADTPDNHTYRMDVYSARGSLVFEKGFDLDYQEVSFLDNGELCVLSEVSAIIYSDSGRERFSCSFGEEIRYILSQGNLNNYAFVYADRADRVRLK